MHVVGLHVMCSIQSLSAETVKYHYAIVKYPVKIICFPIDLCKHVHSVHELKHTRQCFLSHCNVFVL